MKHPIVYSAGQASLLGNRRNNQDRCALITSDDSILLALGDGMGGHPKGEMAAQILIDICRQRLADAHGPVTEPRTFLSGVLDQAHDAIRHYGRQQSPAIDPRTTAVVALIQDGMVHWIHAGDSRFYLFRSGEILTRTQDHSYVERLRQQGIITEQQLDNHPHRNYVTRCLGGNGALPTATLGKRILAAGDTLLLCSDGLWGSLDEALMIDALFSTMSPAEAAGALAEEAAQAAFPESDNVTLLTLKIEALPTTAQVTPLPPQEQPPAASENELDLAIAELQNAITSFNTQNDQEKK